MTDFTQNSGEADEDLSPYEREREEARRRGEWPKRRYVGAALGIGIFLLPMVFAWFTLRRGYSGLSRLLSFAWIFLFLAISSTLGSFGASPPGTAGLSSATASETASGMDSPAGYAVFAEHHIKGALRDPESAKFEGGTAYKSGTSLTICGRVNAKNGFGGYTGSEPYIISDAGTFIGEQATPQLNAMLCQGTHSVTFENY